MVYPIFFDGKNFPHLKGKGCSLSTTSLKRDRENGAKGVIFWRSLPYLRRD